MSSSFPLLRLPEVVLCEVFKSLSIDEKISLSFCSRKTAIQINISRFCSQKVLLYLDMAHLVIRVAHSEDYNYTYTYRKNSQEGFMSFIQHLLKIFHCKISTDINHYNSDLYQSAILMLFDRQMEFKTVTINLKGSEDDNLLLNRISSSLGLIEDLIISSSFNPSFIPVFTSWPQKINIMNSFWCTLESLLTCTSTTIKLDWSLLENKDMDVILRNWKAGGFPYLDRLTIESLRFTNGEQILGMTLMELDGKVIQSEDESKKATLKIRGRSIELSVIPSD
ncbi:hypothetical protein CRE_22049 [Caenorhabditis remanei]|uniref:F-box domain-containing protein n=1 Tax=Caenorhabditis remanei TaxID=31234 RepID=E3N3J6_CAERE|nr:hypothetical protein CRE_22049 [Caenorhabditis remanei]